MSLNTITRGTPRAHRRKLQPVEKITNIDAMAIVERMNTLYDIKNFRDVFENKNEYLYSAINTVLNRKLTSAKEGFMQMSRLDFFKRKFNAESSLEAIMMNFLWNDDNRPHMSSSSYMVNIWDLDTVLWNKLFNIHNALMKFNDNDNKALNKTARNLYESIYTILQLALHDNASISWEDVYYEFEQKVDEHLTEYMRHANKYFDFEIDRVYKQMFGDIQWLKETFFPRNK